MTKAAIGIDPGVNGAIALITDSGEIVVHDMPAPTHLFHLLQIWTACWPVGLVALEKVHIMPRDSKRSGASFMRHVGAIQALLQMISPPWVEVLPQKWAKGLLRAKRTPRDKPSVEVVQRLYPQVPLAGPRGGIKDGRADAVLIARWALKELGGEV